MPSSADSARYESKTVVVKCPEPTWKYDASTARCSSSTGARPTASSSANRVGNPGRGSTPGNLRCGRPRHPCGSAAASSGYRRPPPKRARPVIRPFDRPKRPGHRLAGPTATRWLVRTLKGHLAVAVSLVIANREARPADDEAVLNLRASSTTPASPHG